MAQLLGNVAVGATVYLNENGSPQPYLVVHQGRPSNLYDTNCIGTWLLRTKIYSNTQWNTNSQNDYSNSTVNTTYLPNTILPLYDSTIQNVIKQVKIPYVNGTGYGGTVYSGSNGLSCKIFLLSGYEVGWNASMGGIPEDGSVLSYFENFSTTDSRRIAYLNNSPGVWGLRSPETNNINRIFVTIVNGGPSSYESTSTIGVRPAMILPTYLYVWDDGTVSPYAGPSTTFNPLPSQAMEGQSIPVSWNSIKGADSYVLQRNVDNGGWTQVYSGSNTSFEDTAGSWTTVQYQVQGVFSGTGGPWAQSASIPVVPASTLSISGTDSDLGTITADIPYTVSSDTGNDITLTRTVNGVQVASLTVQSGFAYNIPVVDLPTGTGTIVISASVTASSGTVTATRTWTYTKTAMTFPNSAGIGQLAQNGQNIWPLTVPDAIKTPAYMGGNLGTALNQLSRAVLYNQNQIAKYSEVNINLANVSVGDEVNLPYNGVMVPHIVVHIGNPDSSLYDASCDGVWVMAKSLLGSSVWCSNSTYKTSFEHSEAMTALQQYFANYDSSVKSVIKTVKIPYCVGNGDATVQTGSNGFSCNLFPLSPTEVGFPENSFVPAVGTKLDYFESGTTASANQKRIEGASKHWLRVPNNPTQNYNVCAVSNEGTLEGNAYSSSNGLRPCFIMPTTFTATYLVDEAGNVGTEQEYISVGSYEDILGNTIPVPKIEVGSYVGTGTYGEDNPNTLNTNGTPCAVFITNKSDPTRRGFLFKSGYGFVSITSSLSTISLVGVATTWNENSVLWYSANANNQCNESGVTYDYWVLLL